MGNKFVKPRVGMYFEDFPVKAAAHIYQGDHLVNDGGYARPATSADVALPYLGVASSEADNSLGANGAIDVHVERTRVHRFANSSIAPCTAAQVGFLAYIEDADTVCDDDSMPICGEIVAADSDYVWVERVPTCYIAAAVTAAATLVAPTQTVNVASEDPLVFQPGKEYHKVASSSGAYTLTENFPDGSVIGQRVILTGTSDTNYVIVPDNINTSLANNASMALKLGDKLALYWNGADWEEEWRYDHVA